jgi:hypothetical protein
MTSAAGKKVTSPPVRTGAAKRRRPHDRQSNAKVGTRPPRAVAESCPVGRLAESLGHVTEGCHHPELPEP